MKGSDTLEKVTKQLLAISSCNPGGAIEYLGSGSGNGETAIVAGTQQIAPMSRGLNTCGSGAGSAEMLAIGWDAIVLATASGANCSGPGSDWATTLQTLYGGVGGAGTAAACSDPARQTLADNFSTALCGCTAGGLTKIWHLFRRGDTSGTTDAFKTILAAAGKPVATFCNGTEAQDKDPIRRACRKDEEVCGVDGTLGLVLPIVVPSTEGTSTATEDNIWYRSSPGVTTSVRKCTAGTFVFGPAPALDQSCCHRARANDNTSACLVASTGGKCLSAATSAKEMCNNAMAANCVTANKPSTWRGTAVDGRALNLYARDNTPYAILKDGTNKQILNAFYRLRWTGFGRSYSCTTQTNYGSSCQELDSTREIGCLAKQNHAANTTVAAGGTLDADIGFAGDEARAVGGAYAPNVGGQPPVTASSTINLSYPLKRKLYLNTLKGFENVTGAEKELAKCFATASTINPILTANGFSPLLPSSDPACEQPSCATGNFCGPDPLFQ
jgi:ABC-type phosphate transport system substrate-binding protein